MHYILTAGPANCPARSGADPPVSHQCLILRVSSSTSLTSVPVSMIRHATYLVRALITAGPVLVPLCIIESSTSPHRHDLLFMTLRFRLADLVVLHISEHRMRTYMMCTHCELCIMPRCVDSCSTPRYPVVTSSKSSLGLHWRHVV